MFKESQRFKDLRGVISNLENLRFVPKKKKRKNMRAKNMEQSRVTFDCSNDRNVSTESIVDVRHQNLRALISNHPVHFPVKYALGTLSLFPGNCEIQERHACTN